MDDVIRLQNALVDYFYQIAGPRRVDLKLRDAIDAAGELLGMPPFGDPAYKRKLEELGYTFEYIHEPQFPPESVVFGKLVPPPCGAPTDVTYISLDDQTFRGIGPGYPLHWDHAINNIWITDRTIVRAPAFTSPWDGQIGGLQQFFQGVKDRGHVLIINVHGTCFLGYMRVHAEQMIKEAYDRGIASETLQEIDLTERVSADYIASCIDIARRTNRPSRYILSAEDFTEAYLASLRERPSAALLVNLLYDHPDEVWRPEQQLEVRKAIFEELKRGGFHPRDYLRPTPERIAECLRSR